MDSEKLKLRTKNFWRKNKRLISLIVIAAVVGVITASVNTLHYENTTIKFKLEDSQTISNQEDAQFSFTLREPELATDTSMKIGVENIPQDSSIFVSVNGEQIQELTSSETTIKIPTDLLENSNRVKIYREGVGFNDVKLVSASVTSKTNMQQLVFVLLNFTSLILIFIPLAYVKYQQYLERKRIEDEFPAFLRDVVQGTRAGMSLPQAIQNTETGSYGALDKYIEKMSAQLEWGIPFDEVLNNFEEEIGSPLIQRSVETIIQAYSSGGNIQDVLESVGDNIRSIKQLQEERQSQLYGEMITGYIVYFIFIGILIALTTFLLPNLATASESLGGGLSMLGQSGGASLQENINLYRQWFTRLVYIQALFSGIIIGKLSEGELRAGIKHSGILFAVGYLAVTFFL